MRLRKEFAVAALSLALVGTTMFSDGIAASAAGTPWDYNEEHIAGTPDGVSLWMHNCYVGDADPFVAYSRTDAEGTVEVINPGVNYGCNLGIEVSPRYEEEHGPYIVPISLIVETSTFRDLGVPYVGIRSQFCAPGTTLPYYEGISAPFANGVIGPYGSNMGGFHVNFSDSVCLLALEEPAEPEIPTEPEEPTPTGTPEPQPRTETPVIDGPPPAAGSDRPIDEERAPRAVPDSIQTGVGPEMVEPTALQISIIIASCITVLAFPGTVVPLIANFRIRRR